ncbi:MAG TPA: hypothetical protein VEC36_09130 [Patescibacteria group bacterium]|nr:hypothetical protein [Patescibacteria group bacterium]
MKATQVSFAYPIGSNGISSMEYANKFSFNIIYGLNGGVQGAEIGSVLNYNTGNVSGFQFVGVTNINKGITKGFQLAGVANVNLENTSGFQLSTANIVSNEFSGLQLGVVNYASQLQGVQFGVINIAENADSGTPIGLISFVKNGHFEVEANAGEALYSNLSYKMGVRNLYTIFKAGYSSFNGKLVSSYGLGFGSLFSINNEHNINIDASLNRIAYDNNWNNDRLNSLYKLDANYRYQFLSNFTLIAGPSLNLYITEEKVNDNYGTINIPYSFYTNESSNSKSFMWLGANVGLSYIL